MPEEVKKLVTYDVDGYDIVTKALETVLNTFSRSAADRKD